MYSMLISLVLSLALTGSGGGGDVSQVEIMPWKPSTIYTEEEILEAVGVAEAYFAEEFQGCTLREITYVGDDHADEFAEWAEAYEADEAIVLISVFDVDAFGGDASLNPNDTYEDWEWVLVKDKDGIWRHVTDGYD